MTDRPQSAASSSGTIIPLNYRNERGQFINGNPGNGGRRPGSRNAINSEFASAIKQMSGEALRSLRELLAKNDLTATLWVAERIVGKGKLVEIEATPDALKDALADGVLDTKQASDMANVLAKLSDIESVDALREELAALRRLIEGGK